MTGHATIVERALQVHGHLEPHEYQGLLRHWSNLDHTLHAFDDDALDIQLFIKDRDTASQHVTLEVHIPRHAPLVAHATHGDLTAALHQVRDSMARQLAELKRRNEPRHARAIRDAGRHR